MRRFRVGAMALGGAAFLVGCANMNTVKTASRHPSKGTMYNYPGTCDLHWPKVQEALRNLELELEEIHPEKFEIYAKNSVGAFTWGERVGVWLYPAMNASCNVRVYSVRVGQLNATADDWEPRFFAIYQRPIAIAPAPPASATSTPK